MKKNLFLTWCIVFLLAGYAKAQESAKWGRESRSELYKSISEVLKSQGFSGDMKEEAGLCILNKFTEDVRAEDYDVMIDLEITRKIKDYMTPCSGISQEPSAQLDAQVTSSTVSEPIQQPVTDEWTKERKNVIYSEVYAILAKYEISEVQRELLSLCYVDKLQEGYSKVELDNMITAERKKVKTEILKTCLSENNIELKQKKKQTQSQENLTKQSLIGAWQSYSFKIYLYDSGKLEKKFDDRVFKILKGKWFLVEDSMILIIDDKKEEYKITYFTAETIKMEDKMTGKELHLARVNRF